MCRMLLKGDDIQRSDAYLRQNSVLIIKTQLVGIMYINVPDGWIGNISAYDLPPLIQMCYGKNSNEIVTLQRSA